MNMIDISAKRYTTKHYDKTKKISNEDIDKLCTILQNSPSSVNSQPWHFVVVGNDTGKEKILPAIAEPNKPRVVESSHTVVMCIKTPLDETYLQALLAQEEKDGRYPTEQDKQAQDKGRHFFVELNSSSLECQMAWERKQVYIALGQLLFAAAGMGIDSTAIEGFNTEKMDELLDLRSKGLSSVVVATLGYRDKHDSNASRPKSRLPKDQLFTFL